MSLSRSQVRELRSAGWTVIEEGPLVELRRVLRSLSRRRRPVERFVHLPVRRGAR